MAARRRPPTERPPLSKSRIVAGAMELADESGVDGLTMRALAQHLGFEVMSLYNHVANKDELLAAMADAVAAEIAPPAADLEPMAAIRHSAVAAHDAFVSHPWAADLWLRHLPGPARTDQMEALLRCLEDSGLSPELAHHGFHAVNNHVLGYTLQERGLTQATGDDMDGLAAAFLGGLSPDRHARVIAHVHQHLDGDTSSSFELVLDLILDGLRRLDSGG